MIRELEETLSKNGFDIAGRVRGSKGLCWVIGSRRGTWDHGDKEMRVFVALAESGSRLIEARFKFSVSGTALASEWVRRLTGNKEEFLLQAGLTRFHRLLEASDGTVEEFPEVLLTSRSQPDDFFIDDSAWLENEIERVRHSVLSMLRRSAYKGTGRVRKEQLEQAVCSDTPMVDQTLRYLEGRKFIEGAYGGEMRITPDGEAELQRIEVRHEQESGLKPMAAASGDRAGAALFDVFISHASEDKEEFVRPLASALKHAGLNVWYDEFTLKLGDSLRKSIDQGLASSKFGVVVLSHSFFSKNWPQQELNGLFALMEPGKKKILPIWHRITADELKKFSPMLADLLAAKSDEGLESVVSKIIEVVKPTA